MDLFDYDTSTYKESLLINDITPISLPKLLFFFYLFFSMLLSFYPPTILRCDFVMFILPSINIRTFLVCLGVSEKLWVSHHCDGRAIIL